MSEHQEQKALFEWSELQKNVYPGLSLLHAIPNGQYRSGQKMEPGLKAGVPDICLPVPRGDYHGLYIEMKYGKNKPAPAQVWWIGQLRAQGYRVEVCYNWLAAQDVILDYLGANL